MKTKIVALAALLFTLAACGPAPGTKDQECHSGNCSEADINAPVPGAPAEPYTPIVSDPNESYRFPEFSSSWGLPRAMYEKAQDYYRKNDLSLGNRRYVTVIDMKQHSSKKRWYLFDLLTGKVERYLTSHGLNSDKNDNGYADSFSNVDGSKQSSLGFYVTLYSYSGANGYSMRLDGLSETNSNALSRAIVVHPADYVKESVPKAGRSWGCPALDPKVSESVINRIKDGSLMLIDF